MFTPDLVITLLVFLQPMLLALLLFLLTHQGVLTGTLFFNVLGISQRAKSVRFFECAAYSSLVGHLSYNLQALSLLAVFVIYDVDLFFFVAEVVTFDTWGLSQLFVWLLYVILFFLGLWYDAQRAGFIWNV